VVLHLLEKLPPASYHVTLDNLFVSNKLLEVLRSRGFAATGTCRTNAGVISELIDIKKNDKGPDELPWGTLISMPTASGLVCQMGWKDNAFALAMSTVFDGKEKVTRLRKRPKKTSSKAKTARVPFGDQATKELEIPKIYDFYNHNMLAVDVADQLAASNAGYRRIRRGAWQAIEQWLLVQSLVNCYLVSFYVKTDWEREVSFRNQRDFRMQIVESLLAMSQRGTGPQKRRYPYSNEHDSDARITNHHHAKRPKRSDCMACKGGTFWEKPPQRTPLAQKSANQSGRWKRSSTNWGCTDCNVALCKKRSCFTRYHTNRSN
jgi:hypothetical protein